MLSFEYARNDLLNMLTGTDSQKINLLQRHLEDFMKTNYHAAKELSIIASNFRTYADRAAYLLNQLATPASVSSPTATMAKKSPSKTIRERATRTIRSKKFKQSSTNGERKQKVRRPASTSRGSTRPAAKGARTRGESHRRSSLAEKLIQLESEKQYRELMKK